ncbi:pilus assembly protein TadG-related protein [Nocardioides sp. MAHUQ-72]|uniref:pilus assembly protein TadG-related protein n=1 Tax=unclassified Nocardioides TaxID=2615069 RepID=UPI003618A8FA
MTGQRDERGQATLMIIGFAVVLAMVVALVVDASAAYLQRQGLDTIADGAALRGADLGATGEETYTSGLPEEDLRLTPAAVRAAVHTYLADIGAYAKYPGLTFDVGVDGVRRRVTVSIHAPIDLPLTVPGTPGTASIGSTGAAVVHVDQP